MYEFSAIDGFVEITESLGDMIKYLANEPSVGLYYIQLHAQNAAPNVIHLKNNVVETSHESVLHAEDLEDSISAVRSMQECGFPIAEGMIGDIKRSLSIMSKKQPVKGLIQPTNSSFWAGSSSSWSPATWSRASVNIQGNGEKTVGYLSNVFKTAKQKAGNLKWPQLDLRELTEIRAEEVSSHSDSLLPVSEQQTNSAHCEYDDNQLTASGSADNLEEGERSFSYDSFKADKEANLEEWLEGIGNMEQERTRQA